MVYLETRPSCKGKESGSILFRIDPDRLPEGVKLPFEGEWENDSTDVETFLVTDYSFDLTGLAPGTFHIDLYLSEDSTLRLKATIEEVELYFTRVDYTSVLPTSCSAHDGEIRLLTAETDQGDAPYTVELRDGRQQVLPYHATGLAAAGFMVVLTDANGCSVTREIDLRPLHFPILHGDAYKSCTGLSNGAIRLQTCNNDPPSKYHFEWDNQRFCRDTAACTIDELSSGVYCVTVTSADDVLCRLSQCYEVESIAPQAPFSVSVQTENPCSIYDDGSITHTISGGVIPYGIKFNPEVYNSRQLFAGTYDVTVTDYCGNSMQHSVTLESMSGTARAVHICAPESGGLFVENLKGGTPPYKYKELTNITTEKWPAQNRSIEVTDARGCKLQVRAPIFSKGARLLKVENACAGPGSGQAFLEIANPDMEKVSARLNGRPCAVPCCEEYVDWEISGLDPGEYELDVLVGSCTRTVRFSVLSIGTKQVFRRYSEEDGVCLWDDYCDGELVDTASIETAPFEKVDPLCDGCEIPVYCSAGYEIGSRKIGSRYLALWKYRMLLETLISSGDGRFSHLWRRLPRGLDESVLVRFCPVTMQVQQTFFAPGRNSQPGVTESGIPYIEDQYGRKDSFALDSFLRSLPVAWQGYTGSGYSSSCTGIRSINAFQLIYWEEDLESAYEDFYLSGLGGALLYFKYMLNERCDDNVLCVTIDYCPETLRVLGDDYRTVRLPGSACRYVLPAGDVDLAGRYCRIKCYDHSRTCIDGSCERAMVPCRNQILLKDYSPGALLADQAGSVRIVPETGTEIYEGFQFYQLDGEMLPVSVYRSGNQRWMEEFNPNADEPMLREMTGTERISVDWGRDRICRILESQAPNVRYIGFETGDKYWTYKMAAAEDLTIHNMLVAGGVVYVSGTSKGELRYKDTLLLQDEDATTGFLVMLDSIGNLINYIGYEMCRPDNSLIIASNGSSVLVPWPSCAGHVITGHGVLSREVSAGIPSLRIDAGTGTITMSVGRVGAAGDLLLEKLLIDSTTGQRIFAFQGVGDLLYENSIVKAYTKPHLVFVATDSVGKLLWHIDAPLRTSSDTWDITHGPAGTFFAALPILTISGPGSVSSARQGLARITLDSGYVVSYFLIDSSADIRVRDIYYVRDHIILGGDFTNTSTEARIGNTRFVNVRTATATGFMGHVALDDMAPHTGIIRTCYTGYDVDIAGKDVLQVSCYPDLAGKNLIIKLDNLDLSDDGFISLYTVDGSQVYNVPLSSDKDMNLYKVPLDGSIPAGVLHIKIVSGSNTPMIYRFIKSAR